MERRSEGAVFATSILLLDGWMMVEMRPQAVARREKPSCDRIGVARVFASTSTHARTYTRVTSIEAWSTNYYVSLVPPTFFFFLFFSLFFPRTLFLLSYTPTDRTVYGSHTAVDNVRARGNRFYWSCRELSDASSAWWHGFEQCYHIQRCILSFIYFSSFLPFAKLTLYTLTVYSFAVIQYNREK